MLCKVFGHKWREGWAGAFGGIFGAIVVNIKTCDRCGKQQKEFSSHFEIKETK